MLQPDKLFSKPELKAPPKFDNLLAVLGRGIPSRPTLFEFFLNHPLYELLAGYRQDPDPGFIDQGRLLIRAFHQAGYDYATWRGSIFGFPNGKNFGGFRAAGNTMIGDRKTFDAYPWPDPDDHDYSSFTELAPELPEGMKLVSHCPGGVLENAILIVGFENLGYLIADDPELVEDIFEAIGSRLVRHMDIVAQHDAVGACIANDDWGFKTQPMLSPADMRRYVIPWHARMAEAAHRHGKPAILHSCGNLALLYDDIIDGIGFDGKHSYEDAIQPVEDVYEQYHDRIAILGGIDLDFVCRNSPQAVYERSRAMIRRTAARGGYALGTGNSVPEYVPHENFFAMLAAALEERD